jgi:hypothetical protein
MEIKETKNGSLNRRIIIDNKVKNDIQNLVMNILKKMSIPSIPDGFGHNKTLHS